MSSILAAPASTATARPTQASAFYAPVRAASLLERAMNDAPAPVRFAISGRQTLLNWLSTQVARPGAGSAILMVVRVGQFDAIEALGGEQARDHAWSTAALRIQAFASNRELVADLGDGFFAFATLDRVEHGPDFASRVIDAVSQPTVYGKNRIHTRAAACLCPLYSACDNASVQLTRAVRALQCVEPSEFGFVRLSAVS
jgi:GGDEF domain-containing protein